MPDREFLAIDDHPQEWRENALLLVMERDCAAGFPYVCAGKRW